MQCAARPKTSQILDSHSRRTIAPHKNQPERLARAVCRTLCGEGGARHSTDSEPSKWRQRVRGERRSPAAIVPTSCAATGQRAAALAVHVRCRREGGACIRGAALAWTSTPAASGRRAPRACAAGACCMPAQGAWPAQANCRRPPTVARHALRDRRGTPRASRDQLTAVFALLCSLSMRQDRV